MRIVAGGCMNLPPPAGQLDLVIDTQECTEAELRANLSCWHISKRDWIPGRDKLRLSWRNQGAEIGIGTLKGCIPTAVVAVQMGVEKHVQRPLLQSRVDKRKSLFRVRAVATVHQGTGVSADEKYVVGR